MTCRRVGSGIAEDASARIVPGRMMNPDVSPETGFPSGDEVAGGLVFPGHPPGARMRGIHARGQVD